MVTNDAVPPVATSTWAAMWTGTGRVLRRGSMPLAWAVTLGVCAASAFAVRDVVFPSLEPSASPSLWQPQPGDSTTPIALVSSPADRLDVTSGLPTTELLVPETTASETSVASQAPTSNTTSGSGRRPSGGGTPPPSSAVTATSKPPTSTSTASSAPTTSIGGGDDDATSTSVGGGTTTSSPTTVTTVTETTDPVTTDTLPGDAGGSSGSGRGGRIDDSHP